MDIIVDSYSLCFFNFQMDNSVFIISLLLSSLWDVTSLCFLNSTNKLLLQKNFHYETYTRSLKFGFALLLSTLEYTIFERKLNIIQTFKFSL